MKMTEQRRKTLITISVVAIGIYLVAFPILQKGIEVAKTVLTPAA